MHTDAVVLLTGLSFNAVLAETTSWLSLQYLLIDAFNGAESYHIYLFQPAAKNDHTSRV